MTRERLQVRIVGTVQGVGFRPFVHRLAGELDLDGWVRNDGDGVTAEVEGSSEAVLAFLERVQREAPRAATLHAVDARFLRPRGEAGFRIVDSATGSAPRVWVLPDLASCPDCLADIRDPSDRRHRYPFTNCTHCGPRFTILDALPYDRARTSMATFTLCPDCAREYGDPADRRFHAQPTACPACGPTLALAPGGATGDPALRAASELVRGGGILALKGLGGYHLIVDAGNDEAVRELRARKRRSRKPFAILAPDLGALRALVRVPSFAEPLLTGPQAPIVLLPRAPGTEDRVVPEVAPGSPYLGVFLPYTPLHALLLDDLARPVVATSGNVSDEPIVTDDEVARSELGGIADAVLSHDRPIRRPADDSVVHVVLRPRPRMQTLRRARGYAPMPILAPRPLPPILALGGQMNVTFAFARDREVIVSQHLGDLEGLEARRTYRRAVDDLLRIHEVVPAWIAHDLHPDFVSTAVTGDLPGRRIAVQHHHAHLAACLLENGEDGEALGLTWDGTGYGEDGTVWGGEFLLGDAARSRRVASLRPFRLPGGEAAVHETWRVALALLDDAFDGDPPADLPPLGAAPEASIRVILDLARRGVRAPVTTSAGRLFDGVGAILGLSMINTHQAETAQQVEYAAWRAGVDAAPLPFPVIEADGRLQIDWRPAVRRLAENRERGDDVPSMAAGFHLGLIGAAVDVARRIRPPRVVLAGGCFCNRFLTEAAIDAFDRIGIPTLIHTQLPPTDGSLSAGQLWAAAHAIERGSTGA